MGSAAAQQGKTPPGPGPAAPLLPPGLALLARRGQRGEPRRPGLAHADEASIAVRKFRVAGIIAAVLLGGYLVIGLFANLLLGCGFGEGTTFIELARERAVLIDGIQSYQSIKEVRESLHNRYSS